MNNNFFFKKWPPEALAIGCKKFFFYRFMATYKNLLYITYNLLYIMLKVLYFVLKFGSGY